MATQTSTGKYCVKCGKDVTKDKRMKDSKGLYWCVDCGLADQKQKAATTGGGCSGCGEQYPASQLSVWGKQRLCPKCVKARSSGPGLMTRLKSIGGGGGGGGQTDKGKLIKLLIVFGLLAGVAAYVWFSKPG
jgi:hypothetical protein